MPTLQVFVRGYKEFRRGRAHAQLPHFKGRRACLCRLCLKIICTEHDASHFDNRWSGRRQQKSQNLKNCVAAEREN